MTDPQWAAMIAAELVTHCPLETWNPAFFEGYEADWDGNPTHYGKLMACADIARQLSTLMHDRFIYDIVDAAVRALTADVNPCPPDPVSLHHWVWAELLATKGTPA